MRDLAIITMTFNEKHKLPIWLAHYRDQVGLENCFVIDHGTTDGSTDDLFGASRISIPRSAQDNDQRLRFVKALSDGLLSYFSKVAYVDVDELLIADPNYYSSLTDYAKKNSASVITSIGLEVCHVTNVETELVASKSIGQQRSHCLFSSSMCKINMIARAVNWSAGWHSYDGPPHFDNLFLFHLRHADLHQALARLAITRAMPWASERAGLHQRGSDQEMIDLVKQFGRRPVSDINEFLSPGSPIAIEMQNFVQDTKPAAPGAPYHVPLARYGRELVRIPDRFLKALSSEPIVGSIQNHQKNHTS